MNTLLEAIKELNRLDNNETISNHNKSENLTERFDKLSPHFAYNKENPQGTNTDEKGNPIHGHVVYNLGDIQDIFYKHKLPYPPFPCYLFIDEKTYGDEALKLAKTPSAQHSDKSAHTGVESFLGTIHAEYPDYIYKIR